MAFFDWFTGLSDALQVAFVSFMFTIVSSLTTIWLTNRHTWKLERERWQNDHQRDKELYARSRRDREVADQRRLVESLAGECSSMSMKLAWYSSLSSTLLIPRNGREQKAWPREELESFFMPMERVNKHTDLCRDEQLRSHAFAFWKICVAMLEEINKEDRVDVEDKLMTKAWSSNEMVQRRAREILNHDAA